MVGWKLSVPYPKPSKRQNSEENAYDELLIKLLSIFLSIYALPLELGELGGASSRILEEGELGEMSWVS